MSISPTRQSFPHKVASDTIKELATDWETQQFKFQFESKAILP